MAAARRAPMSAELCHPDGHRCLGLTDPSFTDLWFTDPWFTDP